MSDTRGKLRIGSKLSEGVKIGEPIRGNLFELFLTKLPNVTLHTKTFSTPNWSVSPIEINYFNHKYKIAGATDIPNITLEVYDTIEPDQLKEIWDWWKKIYDPATGELGFASEYKSTGTLNQYNSKGQFQREWLLEGVFPVNINPGSLDYSSFDPLAISIEMSIDNAVPFFK